VKEIRTPNAPAPVGPYSQAVVHGDRLVEAFLHNDTVTAGVQPTPVGHSMPAGLSRAQQDAADLVKLCALRRHDCRFCFTILWSRSQPFKLVIQLFNRRGQFPIDKFGTFTNQLELFTRLGQFTSRQ